MIRSKGIPFLASPVILMLCGTQHFAIAQQGQVINGQCGTADGVAVTTAPTANLCASGTASAVTGSVEWSWKCLGSQGGFSASCSAPIDPAAGATTRAGVPLPAGWTLKQSDIFGSSGFFKDAAALLTEYCEGQYYNVTTDRCSVRIPNVVINSEQQTYVHFKDAIDFSPTDHLTIMGRGQLNGPYAITSAEMVAKYTPITFCVEARYQIPDAPGSWPSFWFGPSSKSSSEIDVEQPVMVNGDSTDVYKVRLFNHPTQGNIVLGPDITQSEFDVPNMTYYPSPRINFSISPHYYTVCYNSRTTTITKWIDARQIYTAYNWRWSGARPNAIVNLAVGGVWTGNVSNPSAYGGDLNVYSIEYYTP
jgi:hypothetical protein